MAKYTKVDVSEQELEDLIRQHAGDIEEGLTFLDHQRRTDSGRLDVLLRDSGGALIVAELKVVEDDGMLMQAIDYFDYVSRNVEAFSRLYKKHSVDPKQELRLILVAPSFSITLIGRCKWVGIPISLITYTCLRFEGTEEIIAIFNEQSIPSVPEIIESYTIEDHLAYIVDGKVRSEAEALLEELKQWSLGKVSLDPIKYAISIKIKGKVFANFHPRRKHFLLSTYNNDNTWTDYVIRDADDLSEAKSLMKAAMEKRDK